MKELKNYTPAALSKDAHLGQVKAFSPVAVPTAPVIPAASDLAAELAAYDSVFVSFRSLVFFSRISPCA